MPFSFSMPMRGEEFPYGHHLGMRRRILLLIPQISPACQHLAVAHDHRAEIIRIIAERRLFQRDAHEALVGLGRGRLDASADAGVTSGSATAPSAPVTR